jgi:hypothetical protein
MKRIFKDLGRICLLMMLLVSMRSNAQLEKIIVEKYYISNAVDSTDTTDGRQVVLGSTTYRVYADMSKGSKLMQLFSNAAHPTTVSSTANFYNNIDRPTEYFGYLVKKQYFSGNPTLALDSWLTLGWADVSHSGVIKSQDSDGSFLNQTGTWGGTASAPAPGLLANTDPLAGIPIRTQDGYSSYNPAQGQWSDNGFKNGPGGNDTTCFGDSIGSSFVSKTAFLKQANGVVGVVPDSNQVLIAQLTTAGNISFSFNLEIKDSSGHSIFYVAGNASGLNSDTIISPYLTYPPVCGCTDPRYMEYDPAFGCSNPSACVTLKVYGCTDSLACNYDPSANVLLPFFCCYPGYCQNRDIGVVCPGLHARELKEALRSNVYPNPAEELLMLQLVASSSDYKKVQYEIYDAFDRKVTEKDLGLIPGNTIVSADVEFLSPGLYLFKVTADGVSAIKKFIKK